MLCAAGQAHLGLRWVHLLSWHVLPLTCQLLETKRHPGHEGRPNLLWLCPGAAGE